MDPTTTIQPTEFFSMNDVQLFEFLYRASLGRLGSEASQHISYYVSFEQ